MDIVLSESISPKWKKRVIIRELIQGQEAATQLKLILQNPSGDNGSLSVEELVVKVMRSFTNTLSVLSSDDDEHFGDHELALPDLLSLGENGLQVVATGNDVPRFDEDSSECWKRSLVSKKNGRGCYKRSRQSLFLSEICVHGGLLNFDDELGYVRTYGNKSVIVFILKQVLPSLELERILTPFLYICFELGSSPVLERKTAQTWTTVSHTTDDNRAWRKYGQKAIQNSKFPRSYFRCSRKYDEGCRATKQLQRIKENPSMYQVTYIGIHTCKATPKAPHLVMDTSIWESYRMNYHPDNSNIHKEQDHPISLPSLKQEYPKKDTPCDVTDQKLDPSQWLDLKDFELSKPDNEDTEANVHSYTGSQGLDIDNVVGSVHHFR